MRTTSCWGEPPASFMEFVDAVSDASDGRLSVRVVGASDGKYVLPFLRKRHQVTAYDVDEVALYGGIKEFPVCMRCEVNAKTYTPGIMRPVYTRIPAVPASIPGLENRARTEGLSGLLEIRKADFFRTPPQERFDIVFTSCSISYKLNADLPVREMLGILQHSVVPGGQLDMDYMMPLEDRHEWKREHYFRSGAMSMFFAPSEWSEVLINEMSLPVFEPAHVDRPEDHFHRLGHVRARKALE